MKEKIEYIAALEEYKQLFTDFFCNPKPRSAKVTRSFAIGEENEIWSWSTFTLEENEFHKGDVGFEIDSICLCYSDMKKDGKKIKIYQDDFLIGIFYLPKQIRIEFSIHYMKSYHMVEINQILINRIVEKEKKEKKDYELKVLPKREGSLRVRIRIRTKDYKKNIERILFYGKIYSYLEIIFEEEVGSVSLCINGLYLFGVSRIKMDERDIIISLSRKKEQSQKEYGIGIRYGEKRIGIYKKHEMIYIVCPPPDQGDDINVGMLPISNKENLDVGYSIYQ